MRFLAALVFACASFVAFAQSDTAFVQGAQQISAKLASDLAAIDAKAQAYDLSTVLVPENLVSARAIRESRTRLAGMLALVKERDAAFQRYLKDAEAYFANAKVDEAVRRRATANFDARKGRMVKVYADLGMNSYVVTVR